MKAAWRTTYESSRVEWDDMPSMMRLVRVEVTSEGERDRQNAQHE
jgi:hypothetical protein